MDADTKQKILALQERMKKGEITPDEYTIAVTRLTDPGKAAEMEAEYLISSLPDYSFDDDGSVDDDIEDGPLPPVPGELTGVYGTRETGESPAYTKAKQTTIIVTLVTVLVIFAITIITIVVMWAILRSSLY